jgi:hypothetical protein
MSSAALAVLAFPVVVRRKYITKRNISCTAVPGQPYPPKLMEFMPNKQVNRQELILGNSLSH